MTAQHEPGASKIELPIRIRGLDHHFEEGGTRKQILFDINAEIEPAEIVIVMGPSGGGKTTLLTLVGALRSVQAGSVRVLGKELRGANAATRVEVRRRIGYVFQQNNLLDSLTAAENVQMALATRREASRRAMRGRAHAMLEAVGLEKFCDHHPHELSGGENQRIAIARALVGRPEILLADEPTAALDKRNGREVVELMQRLAKEQGASVLLVTHDNRILDVADRILHLEDGSLRSFSDAVIGTTRHMMSMLARDNRRGNLSRRVLGLPTEEFKRLLENVTTDAHSFLRGSELSQSEAFESMLDQVLEAFTRKIGDILHADRASLFLLDEARGEIWSKGARDAQGEPFEIRLGRDQGIAGAVMQTGRTLNVTDAYRDPHFDSSADRRCGYRTRSVLCVPLADQRGRIFGVAELINKIDGDGFDEGDERRFTEFMEPMSLILEAWWQMSHRGRPAREELESRAPVGAI